MNILYIDHYAGSPALGMEFRPYYLGREWLGQGHKVRMLAADHSHLRSAEPRRPPAAAGRGRWSQNIDGIDYHFYPTPPYAGNGPRRVLNIAAFLAGVWRDSGRILREFRPDVVIASSTYPMDIWVARRLARRAGAKLVFELHDIWPMTLIEINGMSPRRPFVQLCGLAERAAHRHADLVVSILPGVQDYARSMGLPAERLAIVPNGVTFDEWEGGAEQPLRADIAQTIAEAKSAGQHVLAFTGSHGLSNALDTLLDAASLLRDAPVRFVLVGSGHEQARLRARVAQEGLTQVRMFDPVPKAQIKTLLESVDSAYLGGLPLPIYRHGIAMNKMFDYMMARVPILFAFDTKGDPVTESGCAVSAPPADPQALAQAIRTMAALPEAERRAMGEKGRKHVLEHHDFKVLARGFVDAIEGVGPRR